MGGTAGNGTGSYVRATAGSDGVQWTGGNNVSNVPSQVEDTARNETGYNTKPTEGSGGVQWTGGNNVSTVSSE